MERESGREREQSLFLYFSENISFSILSTNLFLHWPPFLHVFNKYVFIFISPSNSADKESLICSYYSSKITCTNVLSFVFIQSINSSPLFAKFYFRVLFQSRCCFPLVILVQTFFFLLLSLSLDFPNVYFMSLSFSILILFVSYHHHHHHQKTRKNSTHNLTSRT